jgi:hypothetical protein
MEALAAPPPRIVAIEIRGVRRDVPDEASLLRWIVQGEARAEDVCIDVTGQRVAVGDRVDLEDFLEAARLLGRSAAPELTPEPLESAAVAPPPVVAPSVPVAPALASLIDMSFDARDAGDDVDRPTVVVPADLVSPPRVPPSPTVRPPRPSAPVVPSLVDMSFDTGRFGEGERPTVVVPDGPPPVVLPTASQPAQRSAPPSAPPRPLQAPNAEELAWLEAGDRDETETPWAEDEPVAAPAPTPKPAAGSVRVVGVAVAAMLAALGVGVGWTLLRHRAEPEGLPVEASDAAVAPPMEPVDAPAAPAVEPDPRPAPVATGSAATASAGTRAIAAPSVPAPRPVAPTRPVARSVPPPAAKPVAAPPPPPPTNPWATATPAPASPARDAASVIAEGWTTAESGHFVAARSLFTEAIGLGGGAAAYYGRGYAAGKLGDTVAAGDDYCRALAANPPSNQRSELNALLRKLGRSCS